MYHKGEVQSLSRILVTQLSLIHLSVASRTERLCDDFVINTLSVPLQYVLQDFNNNQVTNRGRRRKPRRETRIIELVAGIARLRDVYRSCEIHG